MRAYLIIIFQVRQQYVTEVPLSEHNNVVKAFPSDRTDQPFGVSILQGRNHGVVQACGPRRLTNEAQLIDNFFGRPWAEAICSPEAVEQLSQKLSRFDVTALRNGFPACYSSWIST